jgi:hypothetical protein
VACVVVWVVVVVTVVGVGVVEVMM